MTEDYCKGCETPERCRWCPNNKSKDRCGFCGREISTEQSVRTGRLWKELADTKKKLDIAVSQLNKTRDYIEGCRYQETNYFLVDSKDVSIIFDETNEALERINQKEE